MIRVVKMVSEKKKTEEISERITELVKPGE